MILMIPPVPEASCDASGLVMTSMLLMLPAEMVERSLAVVGTPSMSTRMFLLPLIDISSLEMLTAAAERRISSAVPLLEAIFAEALIVVCSTFDFCAASFASTTTPSREMASSFRMIAPRWISDLSGRRDCVCFVYPMNSTASRRGLLPCGILSLNLPSSPVTAPVRGFSPI